LSRGVVEVRDRASGAKDEIAVDDALAVIAERARH
jgi:hypothetical protein